MEGYHQYNGGCQCSEDGYHQYSDEWRMRKLVIEFEQDIEPGFLVSNVQWMRVLKPWKQVRWLCATSLYKCSKCCMNCWIFWPGLKIWAPRKQYWALKSASLGTIKNVQSPCSHNKLRHSAVNVGYLRGQPIARTTRKRFSEPAILVLYLCIVSMHSLRSGQMIKKSLSNNLGLLYKERLTV